MISVNKLNFKRTVSITAFCNCDKLMDPDIYSQLLFTAQQILLHLTELHPYKLFVPHMSVNWDT